MTRKTVSAELLADHFVNYLFDEYQGSLHVRRVTTWIGFLLKAVEKISGAEFTRNRVRQVLFDYKGRRFKVRFNHKVGRRGGIEFVEIRPGRGQPDGDIAVEVASLKDAETVYRDLRKQLNAFIKAHPLGS